MAKKVAGRGKKTCPKCSKVLGSRTRQCDCGFNFQTAKKQKKAWIKPSDLAGAMIVLERVQGFVDECGGLDSAEAWLEEVESLVAICGSFDGLREALKLSAKLGKK